MSIDMDMFVGNVDSIYYHLTKYYPTYESYSPSDNLIEELVLKFLDKGELEFINTMPSNDVVNLFLLELDGVNDRLLQVIPKGKIRTAFSDIPNKILACIIYSFKDFNNKEYLVNFLPVHKRRRWLAILDNDRRLSESFNKDLNHLKEEMKNIEERRNLVVNDVDKYSALLKKIERDSLEKENQYKNHENRIKGFEIILKQKYSEIEEIEAKRNALDSEFEKREKDIATREFQISEENQKLVKLKVEQNLPGYIRKTQALLKAKERFFSRMGKNWSYIGVASIVISLYCGIFFSIYSLEFINSSDKLEWKYLLINLFKGSIVVGIFIYIAQIAFNISNAYVHESIQRSDKRHAINFGELFLKIYGSSLQKEELLKVFENWNISTDSAFKKIPHVPIHKELVSLLSNLKPEIISKEKKSDAD